MLPTIKSGLNYPPLAFKEFPSRENLLYHMSVLIDRYLSVPLAVATPLTRVKPCEAHWCFLQDHVRHRLIFTLGKPFFFFISFFPPTPGP